MTRPSLMVVCSRSQERQLSDDAIALVRRGQPQGARRLPEGRRRPLRATGALSRLGRAGVSARGGLEEAIVAHLGVLLSARQGSSPASPEYGLEDISDAIHTYPVGAQRIGARIRAAIEAYEPRLAPGVAVELLADDPGVTGGASLAGWRDCEHAAGDASAAHNAL